MAKRFSRKFFQEKGRKGGKIGGKASAAALTKEQRVERARHAAVTRWDKKKKAEQNTVHLLGNERSINE